jgi:membrane complex biogenesis BtpA family protein
MIENNYDIPHYELAKPSTVPQLTQICLQARKLTDKPLGLCVLWNDYVTALSIAKLAKFQFVRIPVFVDKVKTDYGIFSGKASECVQFRKEINAEDVMILADIQVKHATHLIKRTLAKTAAAAIKNKADAVIVTGKWTGDPPTISDVAETKKATGKIPVILGSGITPENIKQYNVDAVIVGSNFKEPRKLGLDKTNIFPWQAKILASRVKKLKEAINK